ncbi:MAG TPA: hypothetical protein EYP10_12760 [Armatimonadetes bacterium]|nr:hypothetical protein [Armatimonadota bacterium]
MFKRFRKLAEIEILIALASGVFGILIGPLLERITSPLFDTPTRALLTGLSFLALISIISVVTTGVFARRHERAYKSVNDELSSINRRLGLTVRFIHDPPKRSTGEVYRIAREIIEKAESEILVLHHIRLREEDFARRIETDEYQTERDKYTLALLEKLRQNKDKRLFYRRVFQLPEGRDTKLTEERLGKRWFGHAKAVLEILDEYPDAGYIKKASVFLEQTYVIVDRRYVIWAIDGIEPEHGVRYMEGALFFDDPHQEFVQYLLGFFQRVDAHAIIVRQLPEV